MPQDDISALNAKVDFLIGKQKELTEKVDFLQSQFDRSKGAIGLIKTTAWLAGIASAVWAVVHGIKP